MRDGRETGHARGGSKTPRVWQAAASAAPACSAGGALIGSCCASAAPGAAARKPAFPRTPLQPVPLLPFPFPESDPLLLCSHQTLSCMDGLIQRANIKQRMYRAMNKDMRANMLMRLLWPPSGHAAARLETHILVQVGFNELTSQYLPSSFSPALHRARCPLPCRADSAFEEMGWQTSYPFQTSDSDLGFDAGWVSQLWIVLVLCLKKGLD